MSTYFASLVFNEIQNFKILHKGYPQANPLGTPHATPWDTPEVTPWTIPKATPWASP